MKKIIVLAGMLAGFGATYAKDMRTMEHTVVTTVQTDNTKTKVDPATLPDAVKKTLAGDAYKDWKVTNVWSIKAETEYYVVELQKDGKTNTIKIDATGKVQ